MNDYRLNDWFYTDNELAAMDKELLSNSPGRYDDEPVKEVIAILNIVSKNGVTGKVMIVKTMDVILTMNALNRVWKDTGLIFTIVKVGKLTYGADKLLAAIETVLVPYRYETKFPEYICADKVYKFDSWMLNLICS